MDYSTLKDKFCARNLVKYSNRSLRECKATSTGDPVRINTGIWKATPARVLNKYLSNSTSICKATSAKTLMRTQADSTRIARDLDTFSSWIYYCERS